MPKEVITPQSAESLEAVADQIDAVTAAMRAMAATLRANQVESLDCTHYHSLTNGLKMLRAFTGSLGTAWTNQLEKGGQFRASKPTTAPRKKLKK